MARCTKIIKPNTDDAQYIINVKQLAKFVVVRFYALCAALLLHQLFVFSRRWGIKLLPLILKRACASGESIATTVFRKPVVKANFFVFPGTPQSGPAKVPYSTSFATSYRPGSDDDDSGRGDSAILKYVLECS